MPAPSTVATHVRFGPFTLDLRAGELCKGATRLKVPDQSIEILKTLLERPGELVTREELRARLWPANHYVDFEHGLNAAVRRLRDALGESADTPKYIETLPRKGYRFISSIDSTAANDAARVTSASPSELRQRRVVWRYVAVLMVLAGLAASVIAVNRRRGQKPDAVSPSGPTFTQLTFDSGLQMNPALSPDGKYVAYASNQGGNFDIWVKPTDPSARAVQVTTDPAHDWQPDWSPDGTQIVFRSERDGGGLYVVPTLGGTERRVADFGYAPRWSPDGTKLLVSALALTGASRGEVSIIDLRNNARRPLKLDALTQQERVFPEIGWYPDGRRVTFFTATGPILKPVPHFVTIDFENGTAVRSAVDPAVQAAFIEHRVFRALLTVESLVWRPDGRAIYFIGSSQGVDNVWTVDVDPRSLAIIGGPRRLTSMSETNERISISVDGSRLVVGVASRNPRVWLYTLDSPGKRILRGEPVSDEKLYGLSPDLTPDGRKLLFLTGRRGSGTGQTEFWERHLESPAHDRLLQTNERLRGEQRRFPRWSPDGKWIAYRYIRPRPGSTSDVSTNIKSLALLDVETLKEHELTTPMPANRGDEASYGWSPDQQYIVASSTRLKPGSMVIALVPVSLAPYAEKGAKIVTQSSEYNIWNTGMSPNQKWICFQTVREGQSQLAVVASTGGPWKWLTGKDAWIDKPRWSADGRIIYFISRRGGFFNVWALEFDPEKGTAVRDPFQLTHFDGLSGEIPPNMETVELGIADRRMAIPVINPKGGIWLVENFRR